MIDWQEVKSYEDITYHKADGIARIAFNRPEIRNAFRPQTIDEMIEAFRDAYALSKRPLLLFNLANAYERVGRYAKALESLRGYDPHALPDERDGISRRILNAESRVA